MKNQQPNPHWHLQAPFCKFSLPLLFHLSSADSSFLQPSLPPVTEQIADESLDGDDLLAPSIIGISPVPGDLQRSATEEILQGGSSLSPGFTDDISVSGVPSQVSHILLVRIFFFDQDTAILSERRPISDWPLLPDPVRRMLTEIHQGLESASLETLVTNAGPVRSRYFEISSSLHEDLDTALQPVAFFEYNRVGARRALKLLQDRAYHADL
jgi:hypothetical protein